VVELIVVDETVLPAAEPVEEVVESLEVEPPKVTEGLLRLMVSDPEGFPVICPLLPEKTPLMSLVLLLTVLPFTVTVVVVLWLEELEPLIEPSSELTC